MISGIVRRHLICFIAFMIAGPVFSQSPKTTAKKKTGWGILLSPQLLVPVGEFSVTHFGGIGISIAPPFNYADSVKKKIHFIYQGSIHSFLGKKTKTAGYNYRYPVYTLFSLSAGISYVINPKFYFNLTGGPGLSVYNGNSRFCIEGNFQSAYKPGKNLAFLAGIKLNSELKTHALWSPYLGVTIPISRNR